MAELWKVWSFLLSMIIAYLQFKEVMMYNWQLTQIQLILLQPPFGRTELGISIPIDGLMQEKRNSIANALELRLSCTNPSIWAAIWL